MAKPSVIIIGAGTAGIAAASKLLENSIANILILEAEDRIGGRIRSLEFGDTFVDLGAEYCHGEVGNTVYQLAKDFDLLEPGSESLNEDVFYSNGTRMNQVLVEKMRSLILDYENLDNYDNNNTDQSVGEMFIDRYNKTLLQKYRSDDDRLKVFKEGLRFAEGQITLEEASFSWFDVSAKTDYIVCEGEQNLIWKRVGYKTILEILMKAYPDPNKKLPIDDKIHYNSKVEKIIWDQNTSITVLTSNNSYSADYVIFTPSIGVLKRHKGTMFDPPLPSAKQEAIDQMGFGGLVKVVVYFSNKWWNDNDWTFSFFWSDDDIKNVEFPHGPIKNGSSWVVQFRDFSRVSYNPNVWVGWFSGDLVPEIEKLPLGVLKEGCQYVLDKFLGATYNVSKIDELIRSDWCSNENFLGVYSYVKQGTYNSSFSYQEKFGEPLKSRDGKVEILFAGEATHPNYYATVHGAIDSGFREAERIIELVKD